MKKNFLFLACAVALLASCSKDTSGPVEPTPTLLGKWQLDNYTIKYYRGGQPVSVQVMIRDSMSQCALDDYYEYNADSSGRAFYGQLCSGETVAQESFRWELYGDVLVQNYTGRQEAMTISNITADYYTAFDTLYPTTGRPDTGTILQQYKRIQ